ncbi:MAG: DUF1566 domain-containing protein [Nitrospinaceae bacterium]
MTDEPRFIDNGDGTVTDRETTLVWTREDTWQRDVRWVSWDEAAEYALTLGQSKFAGYSDWRLPSMEEGMSLLVEASVNKDKYGKEIYLDPAFPGEGLSTFWVQDGVGQDGYVVNLHTRERSLLYKSKTGRMAARGVRGTPAGLD